MRGLLVTVLGCLAFGTAQAAEISYRYFDVGYVNTDISVADGDGGFIAGSWLFDDRWFVFGRYSENDLQPNAGPSSADYEFIRAGVGYRGNFEYLHNTDWYGMVSYNQVDLKVLEDEPESGEDFELGLRNQWRPNLELNIAARYVYSNIDAIDLLAGEFGLKLGGYWALFDKIGLSFAYEHIDRFSEWRIGLRKTW